MSGDQFFGGFDQRLIDQILTKGHGWGLPEPTPPDQIPEALGGTRKHWTDVMIDNLIADKLIGDVSNWQPTGLIQDARNPVAGWFTDGARELGPDPFGVAWGAPADLTVRKLSAIVDVSDELLMDMGAIPDTRPPRPPLPWKRRMRNRAAGWRERLAGRAYKIIAGYDVPGYYAGDE